MCLAKQIDSDDKGNILYVSQKHVIIAAGYKALGKELMYPSPVWNRFFYVNSQRANNLYAYYVFNW